MERELLFKGKQLNTGVWFFGSLYEAYGKYKIITKDKKPVIVEVDPETICQYTGLKLNTGEKIWERDIIENVNDWTKDIYIGVVIFEDGSYFIDSRQLFEQPNETRILLFEIKSFGIKRIGNTIDNPEYLEK